MSDSHDPNKILKQDAIGNSENTSHKVAVGTGTAAGAVAGGVAGSALGPLGTAVGVALGASVGAITGQAAGKMIHPEDDSDKVDP